MLDHSCFILFSLFNPGVVWEIWKVFCASGLQEWDDMMLLLKPRKKATSERVCVGFRVLLHFRGRVYDTYVWYILHIIYMYLSCNQGGLILLDRSDHSSVTLTTLQYIYTTATLRNRTGSSLNHATMFGYCWNQYLLYSVPQDLVLWSWGKWKREIDGLG